MDIFYSYAGDPHGLSQATSKGTPMSVLTLQKIFNIFGEHFRDSGIAQGRQCAVGHCALIDLVLARIGMLVEDL